MKTRNLYIVIATVATMLSLVLVIGCGGSGTGKFVAEVSPEVSPEISSEILSLDNDSVSSVTAFTDSRDGKSYRYVTIGTQTWMAENLNYETASGSWCYDNDESNCNIYGRLYDHQTAMTACPAGWHLPSHDELEILFNSVDVNYGKQTAGGRLKSQSGWADDRNGTDNFGFSALPGGLRIGDDNVIPRLSPGDFEYLGAIGNWWSATKEINTGTGRAWSWRVGYFDDVVLAYGYDWTNGMSVRCIRDD